MRPGLEFPNFFVQYDNRENGNEKHKLSSSSECDFENNFSEKK